MGRYLQITAFKEFPERNEFDLINTSAGTNLIVYSRNNEYFMDDKVYKKDDAYKFLQKLFKKADKIKGCFFCDDKSKKNSVSLEKILDSIGEIKFDIFISHPELAEKLRIAMSEIDDVQRYFNNNVNPIDSLDLEQAIHIMKNVMNFLDTHEEYNFIYISNS